MNEQEINLRHQQDEEEQRRREDQEEFDEIEEGNKRIARQQPDQTDNQKLPINPAEMDTASFANFMKKKQTLQQEEDNISQTIDQQVAGFHIIGEDSTNQVLQVNLYPRQKIFVRGKILYGNFNFDKRTNYAGYHNLTTFLKEFTESRCQPLRKIHNEKSHITYFGLSKAGGKILCIDNDIYGDDICVSPGSIILSNVNHQNSSIVKHKELNYLQSRVKVNQKGKIEKTLVVLQSKSKNIIIEKYLGPKERFYVKQPLIMALSGTVMAERSTLGLFTAKLQGPGWVFVENDSMSAFRENKILTFFGIFLFYMFLVSLINYKNWYTEW